MEWMFFKNPSEKCWDGLAMRFLYFASNPGETEWETNLCWRELHALDTWLQDWMVATCPSGLWYRYEEPRSSRSVGAPWQHQRQTLLVWGAVGGGCFYSIYKPYSCLESCGVTGKRGKSLAVVRDIFFIFWWNYHLLDLFYFHCVFFLNACPSVSQVFNSSFLTPVVSCDWFFWMSTPENRSIYPLIAGACVKFWNPAKIVASFTFLRSWKGHGWAVGVVTVCTKIVIEASQGFWFINIFLKSFFSVLWRQNM